MGQIGHGAVPKLAETATRVRQIPTTELLLVAALCAQQGHILTLEVLAHELGDRLLDHRFANPDIAAPAMQFIPLTEMQLRHRAEVFAAALASELWMKERIAAAAERA